MRRQGTIILVGLLALAGCRYELPQPRFSADHPSNPQAAAGPTTQPGRHLRYGPGEIPQTPPELRRPHPHPPAGPAGGLQRAQPARATATPPDLPPSAAITDNDLERRVESLLGSPIGPAEAIQVALLHNRRLRSRYQELGIARSQVLQAALLRNPVLQAGYRLADGGSGRGALELAIVQDFLDVLLVPMRRAVALAALERTQAEVAGEVMETAFQAAQAAHRLQAARHELALRRQAAEAAEIEFQMACRMRQAGNIRDLDLAGHRAEREQARLQLAETELLAASAREELTVRMGLWGRQLDWQAKPGPPPLPADELDLDDAEARAVARSTDLEVSRQDIRLAAGRGYLQLAGRLLPVLEAGGQAEREADGQWSLGPEVEFPLPVFDQGQAATAAARAQLRRRLDLHAALAVEIRSETRLAAQRLVGLRRQALYHRDIVLPLRRQITQLTLLQYNAMQAGVFDLLQAKRRELEADVRAATARNDYWLARLRMQFLLAGKRVGGPGASASPSASPARTAGTAAQPPAE